MFPCPNTEDRAAGMPRHLTTALPSLACPAPVGSERVRFCRVRVVRMYCTGGRCQGDALLRELRSKCGVRRVTVYRDTAGSGYQAPMHNRIAVRGLGEEPMAIEFYDTPQRVDEVLAELDTAKAANLVSWMADMWMGSD